MEYHKETILVSTTERTVVRRLVALEETFKEKTEGGKLSAISDVYRKCL